MNAPALSILKPDMRARAVDLARRGFRVFPLVTDGKFPRAARFYDLASTDPDRVARMWTSPFEDVEDWNIGILTGPARDGYVEDGLLVIDVDVKDGRNGFPVYEFLADFYEIDGQAVVTTPSGGMHVYLTPPPGVHFSNTQSELGNGVDTRGYHGYVVGPRSTIGSKEYAWREAPTVIPPAPAKLLERLQRSPPPASRAGGVTYVGEPDLPAAIDAAINYLRADAPVSVAGEQSKTTYAVACRVMDFGVSPDRTCELMLEHWNEEKSQPPLYPADIAQRVENAAKYRNDPIGVRSPRPDAEDEFDAVETTNAFAFVGEIDPPIDLWAESEFPADLPLGVLPHALEVFACDEARRKSVDLGTVAVPLLVTFAAALPARFQVQVKQLDTGHTDRAILWGALVGPPGARKTPVLRAVMRPLEEIEAGWGRTYAAEKATYDAVVRAAKQTKGALGAEPPRPWRRRKIVSDVTIEGLAAVLADNPDGLLCFVDELAQWAGNMDAYRAGKAVSRDQSFWLQAKGGGRYQVDRISREVPDVEVNAVNVLGGIQPDMIKRLAPEWGGNGVLQRFLLHVMGRSGPAPDLAPNEAAAAAVRRGVCELVALTPSEFSGPFRFTGAADAHRRDVVNFADAVMARPDVPTPLRGWLDKMEGEWARIALVFHAAEWAVGMGPILDEPIPLEIGADAARRAAAFLIDYQFAHQEFFYRSMGLASEANEDAKAVAAHVIAHGLNEIDDRDLQRKMRTRFGGRDRRAARLAAMQALEDFGWVRSTGAADRNDGKERAWVVRLDVHAEFADRAVAFRARLADQRRSLEAAGAERRAARQIEGPGD